MITVSKLMIEDMPKAMADELEGKDESGFPVMTAFAVIFLFALFGIEQMLEKLFSLKDRLWTVNHEPEPEAASENDLLGSSHVADAKPQTLQNDQVLRNVLMLKTPRQPGLNVGSSTVNTDSNVPDFEWQRWSRLKMEVQNECAQQGWRKWCKELETGDGDMDASTRSVLTSESFTTNRWRTLTELFQLGTTEEFTNDQIKQWHRMWNDNLMFLGTRPSTNNEGN